MALSRLVLIDSSAWIEYLRLGRGAASDAVDGLLQEDRVTLCGTVEAEIIRGIRMTDGLNTPDLRTVASLLVALPYLETERQDYIAAGECLGELRRKGITIPLADALIGVLCLRQDLPLLTLDAHFDHLPDVKRFDAHSPA